MLRTPPLAVSRAFRRLRQRCGVRRAVRSGAVLPAVWILTCPHCTSWWGPSGLTLLEKPDIAVRSLTALRSLRHHRVLHSRTRLVPLSFTKRTVYFTVSSPSPPANTAAGLLELPPRLQRTPWHCASCDGFGKVLPSCLLAMRFVVTASPSHWLQDVSADPTSQESTAQLLFSDLYRL